MCYHKIKPASGQALIENLLIIPLLVIIISAIFWFSRVLLTRQQLLTASRYGTDMILYTTLNEYQIRQEIRNYLSDPRIEGRRLDPARLPDENIQIKIDDFPLPEFSDLLDFLNPSKLTGFMQAMDTLAMPLNHTSRVELYYKFTLPRLLTACGQYLPQARFHESIMISARSEVLAGTGCRSRIHRRN